MLVLSCWIGNHAQYHRGAVVDMRPTAHWRGRVTKYGGGGGGGGVRVWGRVGLWISTDPPTASLTADRN